MLPIFRYTGITLIFLALGILVHQQFLAHEATLSRTVRIALDLEKDWRKDRNRNIDAHRRVECPLPDESIVLVTGGQSNAANTNSDRYRAELGTKNYMFFEDACYEASDPVLGATGAMGSLWSELGATIARETGRPVIMAHTAIGGSEASDWLDRRSGYMIYVEQTMTGLREAGYRPDLLLWHQGETDAAVQKSAAAYEKVLSPMVDALIAAAAETPVYLFVTSKCLGAIRANGRDIIRDTQIRVAEARSGVLLGMNTDMLDNDYRWDTCHFNSIGRKRIVDQLIDDLSNIFTDKNL